MTKIQKNYLMVSGVILPGVATAVLANIAMKGASKTVIVAAFAIGAIAGGFYTAKILK
jgi:uncharacterized protein YcfJ